MFCSQCGKENNKESVFCPECGNKFEHDQASGNNGLNKHKTKRILIISAIVVGVFIVIGLIIFVLFTSSKSNADVFEQINTKMTSEDFKSMTFDDQIGQVDLLLKSASSFGAIGEEYEYDAETQVFSFTYENGKLGAIDMSQQSFDTNGASGEKFSVDKEAFNEFYDTQKAYADQPKKKLHIMYAFGEERKEIYLEIENDLRNLGLDVSVDYDVTVDDFFHLSSYDTVLFSMHGALYKNRPVLCLTEVANEDKDWQYGNYELNNTMIKTYNKEKQSTNYWLLPEFFGLNLEQNSLSKTAILSESCKFLGAGQVKQGSHPSPDRSFPNNFEHAGAVCTSGFYNSVSSAYSALFQFGTIEKMTKDNISIGDSFEKCRLEYGSDDSGYKTKNPKEPAFPSIFGNKSFSLGDVEKGKVQKKKQSAIDSYIDFINKNLKQNTKNVYTVADLNGDDIPEIFVQGPDTASGCHLLTTDGGGSVSDFNAYKSIAMSSTPKLYYHKGQNIFYLSGGRMGAYEDLIMQIKDNNFVIEHKGRMEDYDANPVSAKFIFDGKIVSESDYEQELSKNFSKANATNLIDNIKFIPDNSFGHYEGNLVFYYDGIISYLKSLTTT